MFDVVPDRRLDPDTVLLVKLSAVASRAVYDHRPPAEVIAEMQDAAGDRVDLLAAELGLIVGFWRATSRLRRHRELADALELPGMAEGIAVGWERGLRGGHNARGFGPG